MTHPAVSSPTALPASFTFSPSGYELRAAEAHTAPHNTTTLRNAVMSILQAHRSELDGSVVEALERVAKNQGVMAAADSPTLYDAALSLLRMNRLSPRESADLVAAVRGMTIGLSAANCFSY
ncbi:MAG: hypothetical protein QY326_03480 [Bdellovibrionota bacterium]|nr:MAG: hypothetical protein QY326_03480 [Bdellovibrionota bacterium]